MGLVCWNRELSLMIVCILLTLQQNAVCETEKVYITVLLPQDTKGEPTSLKYGTEQVVKKAVDALEQMVDVKVEVTVDDTQCSSAVANSLAGKYHKVNSAQVFIGPSCEIPLESLASVTELLNVPVISTGAWDDIVVKDKNRYKHVIRAAGAYEDGAAALGNFIESINTTDWTRAAIMYPTPKKDEPHSHYLAGVSVHNELMKILLHRIATDDLLMRHPDLEAPFYVPYNGTDMEGKESYEHELKKIKQKTRGMLACNNLVSLSQHCLVSGLVCTLIM